MTKRIKPESVDFYNPEESLDLAWERIKSNLPITTVSQALGLVMTYHNTLLKELKDSNHHDSDTN